MKNEAKKICDKLLAIIVFSSVFMTAVSAEVWSPSLPARPVTIEITNPYTTPLYPDSYPFIIDLNGAGTGFDLVDLTYTGWCVDIEHGITREVEHGFMLYSSFDVTAPIPHENWDIINCIINNKQGNGGDVQAAIWYFINDFNYHWSTMPFTPSNETETMVSNALANGRGYRPGEGDLFAIVCVSVDENPVQTTVIEVVVPEQLSPAEGAGPEENNEQGDDLETTPKPSQTPLPSIPSDPAIESTANRTNYNPQLFFIAATAIIVGTAVVGALAYKKQKSSKRSTHAGNI